MKIALDYDGTYTEDPYLWDIFITKALLRNHEIFFVTFRPEDCPIDYDKGLIDVYYTSAVPKKFYMDHKGIKVDVWIDDNPDLIINHSDWSAADRLAWKKANGFA